MIRTLDPRAVEALVAEGDLDIVDVREPNEWSTGHLPGARNLPLERLRADPETALPRDRVLFVCAKGARSLVAAKIAERRGLTELYSLEGGTRAWAQLGLPLATTAPSSALTATAPVGARTSAPTAATAPVGAKTSAATAPTVATAAETPVASVTRTAAPPATDPNEPGLDAIIGANLKALRADRGLSLDALARAAGVSRADLGQLELGRSVPSINRVWKLARALGVPFATLVATAPRLGTTVLRRSRGRQLVNAEGRFGSRALFPPSQSGTVEFYELWLAAHSREEAEPHQPGTRENLVVVTGRLDLAVGGEKFRLEAGDAVVFTADVPHSYTNSGSDECWMHLVMTYLPQAG